MVNDDSSKVIVSIQFYVFRIFCKRCWDLEQYRTGTEGTRLDLDSLKLKVCMEIVADSHLPGAESH